MSCSRSRRLDGRRGWRGAGAELNKPSELSEELEDGTIMMDGGTRFDEPEAAIIASVDNVQRDGVPFNL